MKQKHQSFPLNHKVELCINQYLVLLLRCVYFYKNVLSVCATVDYLEESLYIYHHSQSSTTRLLTVKFLRNIISYIPDSADGRAKDLIEKFLIEVLNTIGENGISQEILAELVYMYRTIMSVNSSWQLMAAEIVFDSIQSHLNLNSIESNDTHQMNKLLASLCIVGGYIEPYRLGSIVKAEIDKETTDEPLPALIIEIDPNAESPYTVQYLQKNQIESVIMDKFQLDIDVPPPNLLSLPISKDSVLDTLGHFIQIDTTTSNSLVLLELKRRCVSILHYLLNDKILVELFMEKPYASVLAKLCICDSQLLTDLRAFNKPHLEQYCLSLDTCERLKQIKETENLTETNEKLNSSPTSWSVNEINRDPLIMNALSVPASKYGGWKPYASEEEIKFFRQGRLGKDEISLVSFPRHIADPEAVLECGTKHRFRGRIEPKEENTRLSFPTFFLDNLQLSEGKWYYCIRLPVAGLLQIGWATNGFSPGGSSGVGDDKYSWSYDGSSRCFLQ